MTLKEIIQRIVIAMRTVKVSTGIIPMARVKSAVVFVDPADPDFKAIQKTLFNFFHEYKLNPKVVAPTKNQLSLLGRVRRSSKWPCPDGTEDLFISLVNPNTYAVHYAAARSQAKFLIGRSQLPGDLFDVVLADREGVKESTLSVLSGMIDILKKIK